MGRLMLNRLVCNEAFQTRFIILFACCFLLLSSCSLSNMKTGNKTLAEPTKYTTTETVNTVIDNSYAQNQTPAQQNIPIETANTERQDKRVITPDLPVEASSLESFIISGWKLLDSVELDFNADGMMDFIGVLDYEDTDEAYSNELFYPRILFAVVNRGNGSYRLDFQDINLIRTRNEGGIFGDPYEPITTEDNTFTIHAYGGSAWRWRESASFKYINGGWYLINEEDIDGYGPLFTYYSKKDYESGVGFQGHNNDDFDYIENIWSSGEVFDSLEQADYDLSFRIETGPPIPLREASQRWWLSPDRLEEIQPVSIVSASGVDVDPSDIPLKIEPPYLSGDIKFIDENYILYTFKASDKKKEYLAVYNRCDNSSFVSAQTNRITDFGYKDTFSDAKIYRDMIYFEELIYAKVKIEKDGAITEELEHVASRLVRMNMEGDGKETVFEYIFLDENDTLQHWAPYCYLGFDFADNGVIINLYCHGRDTQYYFIEQNGGNTRFLGSVRGTSSKWLGELSLIGRIGDDLNIHMQLNLKNGWVEGSYYYDKYGKEIYLSGYYSRGSFELYETGGTGRMYGFTVGDIIKGAWTKDTTVLPLVLVTDDQNMPEPEPLNSKIKAFEGQYRGIQSNEDAGSDITITPLFNDLAYINFYAFRKTIYSVHLGDFNGLAVFDNNGLNYQANEKTYVNNETIIFRLSKDEADRLILDTNNPEYYCGAGVQFDTIYTKE